MKIIVSILTAVCISSAVSLATVDSVSMGAQYANQVWYSLESGIVGQHGQNSWDLAFQIAGISGGILTNGAKNIELYHVASATPETFDAAIDTTGIATWTKLYNNAEYWEEGAFNRVIDATNPFDFGWGEYNMNLHTVAGTKVFVIKYGTTYKKIMIDGLASKKFTFTTANIDNSDKRTDTVDRAKYLTKNFAYWSFATNQVIDREPESAAWDLTFTRYIDLVPAGPGSILPYPVMGIFSNDGVLVAELNGVNPSTITAPADTNAYSDKINTIGSDWKTYNTSAQKYEYPTDRVYFVKVRSGKLYKVICNGFSGGATATSTFTKEAAVTSVLENTGNTNVQVFSNVIEKGAHIEVVLTETTANQVATIQLVNSVGQVVSSSTGVQVTGLTAQNIPTRGLAAGMYMVAVQTGNNIVTLPVILQ